MPPNRAAQLFSKCPTLSERSTCTQPLLVSGCCGETQTLHFQPARTLSVATPPRRCCTSLASIDSPIRSRRRRSCCHRLQRLPHLSLYLYLTPSLYSCCHRLHRVPHPSHSPLRAHPPPQRLTACLPFSGTGRSPHFISVLFRCFTLLPTESPFASVAAWLHRTVPTLHLVRPSPYLPLHLPAESPSTFLQAYRLPFSGAALAEAPIFLFSLLAESPSPLCISAGC